MRITVNEKKKSEIRSAIKSNNGYCPCKIPIEDNKCPCKDFRDSFECICELYLKVED